MEEQVLGEYMNIGYLDPSGSFLLRETANEATDRAGWHAKQEKRCIYLIEMNMSAINYRSDYPTTTSGVYCEFAAGGGAPHEGLQCFRTLTLNPKS